MAQCPEAACSPHPEAACSLHLGSRVRGGVRSRKPAGLPTHRRPRVQQVLCRLAVPTEIRRQRRRRAMRTGRWEAPAVTGPPGLARRRGGRKWQRSARRMLWRHWPSCTSQQAKRRRQQGMRPKQWWVKRTSLLNKRSQSSKLAPTRQRVQSGRRKRLCNERGRCNERWQSSWIENGKRGSGWKKKWRRGWLLPSSSLRGTHRERSHRSWKGSGRSG